MVFPGNREPNIKTGSSSWHAAFSLKNTGYLLALIPDFTSSLSPQNFLSTGPRRWRPSDDVIDASGHNYNEAHMELREKLVFLLQPWFRCVSEHDFISKNSMKKSEGIASPSLKLHNLWPRLIWKIITVLLSLHSKMYRLFLRVYSYSYWIIDLENSKCRNLWHPVPKWCSWLIFKCCHEQQFLIILPTISVWSFPVLLRSIGGIWRRERRGGLMLCRCGNVEEWRWNADIWTVLQRCVWFTFLEQLRRSVSAFCVTLMCHPSSCGSKPPLSVSHPSACLRGFAPFILHRNMINRAGRPFRQLCAARIKRSQRRCLFIYMYFLSREKVVSEPLRII